MAITFVFAVKGPDTVSNPWSTNAVDSTGATLLLGAKPSSESVPVTDNKTNSYTALERGQENTNPVYTTLFYANSATPTVGAAHTASVAQYWCPIVFFGFAGTAAAPLDQHHGLVGAVGVTSHSTGLITPTEGGCVIVSQIAFSGPVTGLTPPAGYTMTADMDMSAVVSVGTIAVAYKIKGASDVSDENPTWSWTTARAVASTTTSFKASASSDTTAPTISAVTGTGGVASSSGSFSSDEAGTAFWKATATATPESVPAYPAAMTGWTSQAMTSGANTIASLGTTPGTYWLQVVGQDATGNRSTAPVVSAASYTITAPVVYGFDFHDPTKRLEFGNTSGTLVDLALESSVAWTWTVHDPAAMGTVVCSGSGTTHATTARLARFENAALASARYVVVFQSTDALATRKVVSIIMLATVPA